MVRKSLYLFGTLMVTTQLNGPAQAASFNCAYAKLPVEVAICQDSDLESLDERMANYFFKLRELLPRSAIARLRREQNSFIARRNHCGYNGDCISNAYENRIARMCRTANVYGLDCDEFGD